MAEDADILSHFNEIIAQANRPATREYLVAQGCPPPEVAQRLLALSAALVDVPKRLSELYAQLDPPVADWLAAESVDDRTREALRGIFARNREAFAALAEL